MKPTLIIFSSGKALPVANGIRDNLKDAFRVTVWTEGFFDEHNTIPLWVFLKNLMCFDFAAVVLGADDTRKKDESEKEEIVPRDNVIFELGATMSRLGPHKTFIFTPAERHVVLPSYFKGVLVFDYESAPDSRGNYQGATGSSCTRIKNHLRSLSEDAFHSDLPAQGLAIGYFNNLILPVYEGLREPQEFELPSALPWNPGCRFTFTALVPNEILTRASADRLLKERGAINVMVRLFRSRDVSVYALPRNGPDDALHIVDVPTTLLTATKVIEKIDSFWGSFGDTHFQQQLQQRELLSFGRKLRAMRSEGQLDDRILFVEPLESWREHFEALRASKPPAL